MYLSKTVGSAMPGRGLINPAFVIKIVPATDNLQQQPSSGRDNPTNDYLDNLKVGTEVKANVNGKTIYGKVQRIMRNQLGDGTYVVISDSRGKIHKIEGSKLIRIKTNNLEDDRAELASSPAVVGESRILSFEKFSRI
jgi:hypothetical protein